LQKKLQNEELKQNKKVKIFIQVNIGDENQKSGITKNNLDEFYSYCKELELDIIGLMCIPPANIDPKIFFQEMKLLTKKLDLPELSMGMSSDYLEAAKNSANLLKNWFKDFWK
jgi:uncharacterized pyridoxal phosphate-containing UPF0001 family protein